MIIHRLDPSLRRRWLALALLGLCCAPNAGWAEAGEMRIRGSLTNIDPSGSGGGNFQTATQGVLTDTQTRFGSAWTFSLNSTYQLTEHWGIEVMAASPSRHELSAQGASLVAQSPGVIADVEMIPTASILQFHFSPTGKIRPYVGLGMHYTFFLSERPSGGLRDAYPLTSAFDLANKASWVAQFGVDFALGEDWFFNADMKYLDLSTQAHFTSLDTGSSQLDLNLDPWMIGLGVGRHF